MAELTQAPASCCAPAEQATCCEAENKAACCDAGAAAGVADWDRTGIGRESIRTVSAMR